MPFKEDMAVKITKNAKKQKSFERNTVKAFNFAAPIFCESVTEDIIVATKFIEFQKPALKLLKTEIFVCP